MKILEVIPTLGSGGAEKFVVELSNELSLSDEIECDVLQFDEFSVDDVAALSLNQKVHRFSLGNRDASSKFSTIWKLFRFILHHKYDVVHVHISAINYIILSSICCIKTKFFATIHSEAKREAGGFLTAFLRKILFSFKLCIPITISEESQKSFSEFYKLDSYMIYNGVNPICDSFNQNPFKEYVGLNFIHVARVHPVKNQMLLYKSVQKLVDEGENINLFHLGRFSDDVLSHELKKVNCDRIHILGEVENVKAYMEYSDALCLSSSMEGMPITIIEAFSTGLPVLSTPVGGCKNMIVNGENGFLSTDLSERAYYNILKRFISLSKEEHMKLRKGAKISFDKYNINKTAASYLKLFDQKVSRQC